MRILSVRATRKLREWLIHYLPAEITGTITAFAAFFITKNATDSLAAAAIVGSVGETIGYYAAALGGEVFRQWRSHHMHARFKRIWLTSVRSLGNLIVEFGPAEIVDSLVVRPGLFYLLPLWFSGHLWLALLAAKLLSDLAFYTFAIAGYEIRKKLLPQRIN
ncbi:MAG TPA: hypothetical protein VLF62_03710 [Candidatus Saccharimonadales bacterium]|nr:hypothetical protein [Candidatus Saccharimonadales bacterium]